MTDRQKILEILKAYHPSDAIKLIESIGKHIRRENSIRISNVIDNIRIMTKR